MERPTLCEEIVPTLAILGFFVDEMFANQINFGLFPSQKFLSQYSEAPLLLPALPGTPHLWRRVCPGYRRCQIERNARIGVDNFDLNFFGFAGQLLSGNLSKVV